MFLDSVVSDNGYLSTLWWTYFWTLFLILLILLNGIFDREELKHRLTGLLFYVNVDDESYVFQKPDLVMQEDINNVGNHIINANRPEDWRRMRLHAGMLIFLDDVLLYGIFDTLFLF